MLCNLSLANARPLFATFTGSPTPLPGSGAKTGIPALLPTTCNCVTAFGRCKSEATNSGVLPWSFKYLASFPASEVLPAPCRPVRRITVGGRLARRIRRALPPRTSIKRVLTISKTAFAGLVDLFKLSISSKVLVRIFSIKLSTTEIATSESRSALLISTNISSISEALRRPLLRSEANAPWNLVESDSNMAGDY